LVEHWRDTPGGGLANYWTDPDPAVMDLLYKSVKFMQIVVKKLHNHAYAAQPFYGHYTGQHDNSQSRRVGFCWSKV